MARDIITIAGSVGSAEELSKLVRQLPESFSGAMFVVVHTSPEGPGLLAEILDHASQLPVHNPKHGEPIKPGYIYVAKPNHHLLVLPGHVELSKGPRENGFRPAADPLFRTAAQSYGPRVVGIVLSGGMDDGTLGLKAIKQHGGIAIVQDPKEAFDPSMPESAMRNVNIDHVLPVKDMPAVLLRLVRSSLKETNGMKRRQKRQGDPAMAADLSTSLEGPPSSFSCPECGGGLWELKSGHLLHYRCHVGHAYTAKALLSGQDGAVEEALWTALRTLEESAALRRRLAGDARVRKQSHLATSYEHRAKQMEDRAGVIREVLLHRDLPKDFKGYGSSKPAKVLSRRTRTTKKS